MHLIRMTLMVALVAAAVWVAPVSGDPHRAIATETVEPVLEQPSVDLSTPGEPVQVEVPAGFSMIAITWDPAAPADVSPVDVRVRSQGQWSDWATLEVAESAVEPGTAEAAASRPATEPMWVGQADAAEVRASAGQSAGLPRLELIDPGVATQDDDVVASARPGQAVAATLGPPRIISRAEWGADESLRSCTPSKADRVKAAVVHHTAGSNNYSPADSAGIIRAIYAFHTQSRGWCDIGYNFLVDRFGNVFEGRFGGTTDAVIGAHTGGFNTGTVGVSMMGTHSSSSPPRATTESVARLLAWRMGPALKNPKRTTQLTSAGNSRFSNGTVVTVPTIVGHRDLYQTECPGDAGYRILPALRTRVSELAPVALGWLLRDSASAGSAGYEVYYGAPGMTTLACDLNGDGRDSNVAYQNGTWYGRTTLSEGAPDLQVAYGFPGAVPVCGDWDGNGTDTLGVYFNGVWYLRNSNTPGPANLQFSFGFTGTRPVVGDWDGNGRDGIGIYHPATGTWYTRQTASAGSASTVRYGWNQALPVPGDWDGNGTDTLGVFHNGQWLLRDTLTSGPATRQFTYGWSGTTPATGNWDGSTGDGIGVSGPNG